MVEDACYRVNRLLLLDGAGCLQLLFGLGIRFKYFALQGFNNHLIFRGFK